MYIVLWCKLYFLTGDNTSWRETDGPKCVARWESPEERTEWRRSGFALCSLGVRGTGGEKQGHDRWLDSHQLRRGPWSGTVTLAGALGWWTSGVLLYPIWGWPRTCQGGSWKCVRQGLGSVLDSCYCPWLFLQWFLICKVRDTGKVFKVVSSSLDKVCSFMLPNSVVSVDAPHFAYPFAS